jgi:GNAT superfamily N-acetyltransferase
MPTEIIPFNYDLLSPAAELLAGRHQRDRKVFPLLPACFAEPDGARDAIEAALQRPHAAGFAALENGRLQAYLIGDMLLDALWGRSGWIRTPGCAYSPQVGPEIIKDLYAALGARWVRYGIFYHVALIPLADPALLQVWFELSFGIENIHALADLKALQPQPPRIPPEIELRKAGPQDGHYFASLSDILWQYQVQAPVWGVQLPESVEGNRVDWASLAEEADVTAWLAFRDGELLGSQGYWPADPVPDDLLRPQNGAYMSAAATRPSARQQGVGTLLSQTVLADAYARGFPVCETNWRSTNLLAARFWPRRGYQPMVYRLVRRIDQRITWANGAFSEI